MHHEIVQTHDGLQLFVNGGPIALIRQRGGALDLVWSIRGPQDLDTAKQVVTGLIDLFVTYDSMKTKERKKHADGKDEDTTSGGPPAQRRNIRRIPRRKRP